MTSSASPPSENVYVTSFLRINLTYPQGRQTTNPEATGKLLFAISPSLVHRFINSRKNLFNQGLVLSEAIPSIHSLMIRNRICESKHLVHFLPLKSLYSRPNSLFDMAPFPIHQRRSLVIDEEPILDRAHCMQYSFNIRHPSKGGLNIENGRILGDL